MRSAVVVGAGIAGIATAVRLRRSGWRVTVIERADDVRGGGYMIGFSGVGYRAARDWGLIPALRERQPAQGDLVYVDETGRERAVLPVAAQQAMVGEEMLSLLRGDLEEVLFAALNDTANDTAGDAAGDVEVRFGTTVTRIVQDNDAVTATLTDGTVVTADLLVGADGLHSVVRRLVFGPEDRFRVDLGCAVGTVLLEHVPAGLAPGRTVSMSGVGRGVGFYTTRSGRGAGFFAFGSADLDADMAAGARTTLRRVYGDLGWVVPDLLDQVEASDSVYFDRISQVVMDRWSRGRVVLLGDAAWCVSLFAGHGSSLAVGGADLLGRVLDEQGDSSDDLPAALECWEKQLRPIVARKQRQGRRASGLFVPRNQLGVTLRYAVLKLAGSRLVLAAMRRFLGLEAPASPGSRTAPKVDGR